MRIDFKKQIIRDETKLELQNGKMVVMMKDVRCYVNMPETTCNHCRKGEYINQLPKQAHDQIMIVSSTNIRCADVHDVAAERSRTLQDKGQVLVSLIDGHLRLSDNTINEILLCYGIDEETVSDIINCIREQ